MINIINALNHTDFFYKALRLVAEKGKHSSPRGMEIAEVENVIYQITKPYQKQLFIPQRGNNPIATMAEVLWILAGRNDMEYLTYYLPRAIEYSDDGKTWRGGYGPRLRNWNGIDQIREVVKILEEDRSSRRAVMMIFDPDRDFVQSKDIPCNNQIAVTIRDSEINIKVCSRSMDIIWGSTINTITFSIFQEILAGILNAEIGTMTYFISSFHLYYNFFERMEAFRSSEGSSTPYENQEIPVLVFNTFNNVDDLDNWLDIVMGFEKAIRNGEQVEIPDDIDFISRQILEMFQVRRYLWEGNLKMAQQTSNHMGDTDFSRSICFYVDNYRH